jgi:hypothetical protein
MSLGAVVAVAQQVGYYGRGYLGDEVLQRGSRRVIEFRSSRTAHTP